MAAVLAAGPGSVVSHRSAAALWGLRPTAQPRLDVTAPRKLQSRAGLRLHHAVLPADETTVHHGIPVTTAARTLLDLAAVVEPHALERALERAQALRLADSVALPDLLARYPGRRGTVAVRAILDQGRLGTAVTRSELEDAFLAFLDRFGLPRPAVNVVLQLRGGSVEADCVWREQGVVVELDGYATHGTRSAFERDRARDRRLQAAGWRVVRVTWRALHRHSGPLASELAALLMAPVPPKALDSGEQRADEARAARVARRSGT